MPDSVSTLGPAWECRECDVQWRAREAVCWCCGTDVAGAPSRLAVPSIAQSNDASHSPAHHAGTPLTRWGSVAASVGSVAREDILRAAALGLPDPRAPKPYAA